MNFLVANTFTESFGRLTGQEQKAVKVTVFDLQMDASAPGLSFHKIDRAKDPNFWSVRVNVDLRLIIHRTLSNLLLAYVGHHDPAYKWAERRKIERHPTTGAMQLVELRERVELLDSIEDDALAPRYSLAISAGAPSGWHLRKPRLFDNLRKFELMAFGVPEEWVDAVRAADEDTLFDVASHLPQEAQEALLKLAVGEKPEPMPAAAPGVDPYNHPDAQRRFRQLDDVEALRRALDAPWETWATFLHPSQAALITRDFGGPARVSGSAGTGKTIVALHRAAHLARKNPDSKVLLTTFSDALARAFERKLATLVAGEPQVAERVIVRAIGRVGVELYAEAFGAPNVIGEDSIRTMIAEVAAHRRAKASLRFLTSEWIDVIEPWQVRSTEEYGKVSRLGRKTRLGANQRDALWPLFEDVRQAVAKRGSITRNEMFARVADAITRSGKPPYDFVVIDEAQDLSVGEAKFLSALGGGRPNALFFAGDLGQRIFRTPFSWKSLGIDVRGRSIVLRVNYRTSHQIRSQADRLLPDALGDVDGNLESRKGTVSVFDGPAPLVRIYPDVEAEAKFVGAWIAERIRGGLRPEEIAVFVRSDAQIERARAVEKYSGAPAAALSADADGVAGHFALCTMHAAKGLEFSAVAVMACDDEVLPQQERIESVADDADLEEVYNTERHLLYVACTRARDHLLVTGTTPESEFLRDFVDGPNQRDVVLSRS